MLRVRCVGMNMWARPGASNGASTHMSAQASRTRSGMRYIHTHTHTSFHTERFSRVDALLDSLPHEFDEGIGRRGRTPPQGTSPPWLFVVCHSDARVRALHGVVQWLPHTCMRANTHAGIYSPALPYIGSLMSTCCHQRVCLRACVHLLGCASPHMHALRSFPSRR